MIAPADYFRALKQAGFRIRIDRTSRDIKDVWGTSRQQTLSRYVASINLKGHIVAINGAVHVVGDEIHVSVAVHMTTTLLKLINPLVEVPTAVSVDDDMLADILSYAKKAASLDICTDYVVLKVDKV